jgi:DNA-binding response OmpR family regulator
MDDEKIIRDLAARMLRKGGYEVDLASSGEEALDIYKRAEVSGTPFDAIILDLTIRGGMGGMETASALRKLDANVGIIISSGYSSYSEFSRLGDCGFIATIPKPYLINELLDTVKGVVSRRRRCLEKAKPSHELPGSSPIEGS